MLESARRHKCIAETPLRPMQPPASTCSPSLIGCVLGASEVVSRTTTLSHHPYILSHFTAIYTRRLAKLYTTIQLRMRTVGSIFMTLDTYMLESARRHKCIAETPLRPMQPPASTCSPSLIGCVLGASEVVSRSQTLTRKTGEMVTLAYCTATTSQGFTVPYRPPVPPMVRSSC